MPHQVLYPFVLLAHLRKNEHAHSPNNPRIDSHWLGHICGKLGFLFFKLRVVNDKRHRLQPRYSSAVQSKGFGIRPLYRDATSVSTPSSSVTQFPTLSQIGLCSSYPSRTSGVFIRGGYRKSLFVASSCLVACMWSCSKHQKVVFDAAELSPVSASFRSFASMSWRPSSFKPLQPMSHGFSSDPLPGQQSKSILVLSQVGEIHRTTNLWSNLNNLSSLPSLSSPYSRSLIWRTAG